MHIKKLKGNEGEGIKNVENERVNENEEMEILGIF